MTRVDRLVGGAQEVHRLPILAPALGIGDPLAGLARIVEVEHRRDRVDAQPIDMELLGPVERIVDQERKHLAPTEIIDRGLPVRMEA